MSEQAHGVCFHPSAQVGPPLSTCMMGRVVGLQVPIGAGPFSVACHCVRRKSSGRLSDQEVAKRLRKAMMMGGATLAD